MVSNTLKKKGPNIIEVSINFGGWGDSIAKERKQLEKILDAGHRPFAITERGPVTTYHFYKKGRVKRCQ